ncbi:MAG: Ig-like domain-containing protein [Candidatus Gracilibacteria bacterium]
MKKIISLIVLTFVSILGVSADNTGTGVNSAPVAVDDIATTNEGVAVNINVLGNDTDTDTGTTLTVSLLSNIVNGFATITASGNVRYTPFTDFNGTGSFDYVVSNGALTDIGHVVIIVNPVNDSPVAVDDTFTMVKNTTVEINLVGNDTDVDGDNLFISSLGAIINGTGTITTSKTGVIFTPNTDFVGTIIFSYVVSDGILTDTGTVTVTINSANSLPVANDDKISTYLNTEKTFDPRINDTDANGDVLTIIGKTDGIHGTVSFSSTGVTYKPYQDFYGSDSFTYTISDGKGGTDIGTVKVTVIHTDYHDKPVQNVQKEFIGKFKELKNRYRNQMNNREYISLKNELRNQYLLKLKEVTGQGKQGEPQENDINVKYKYQGNSFKIMYKNQYEIKYGNQISSFNDAKLKIIIGRIDTLINDINSGSDYSELIKAKLNTMLLALRELILENMDDSEGIIDIDSLFE